MTAANLALLALCILGAAFTAWALRPRRQFRPGPKNNWRQRGPADIESAKTDATGGNTSPVDVALGLHAD
jgi:hypothetical protein